MKQGTQEWLDMRKKHVMASDAPVIMNGFHFEKTPYKLWKEKVGIGTKQKDNAAMRYGRETEHKARLAYQVYSGNTVKPEIVFHPKISFMGASLDGLTANGDMAVEIKCPGFNDHSTAKKGKIPEKYMPQLQHQLACLDLNELHYFSFREDEGILVEVERDENYIDKLCEKEGVFWEKVLNLNAPSLTSRDYKDMEKSPEWKWKAKKWYDIRVQLKDLEEDEKKLRAYFIEMSGEMSSMGHGVRACRIVRKGNVDYKAIPELEGIDLDLYRKKPIETWRIEPYEDK